MLQEACLDFYGLFFALLFFLLVWCDCCVQSQRKKVKVVMLLE